jgi:hypothetical protein
MDTPDAAPSRGLLLAGLSTLVVGQCLHGVLFAPMVGAALGVDPVRGAWVEGTRGGLLAVALAVLGGVLAILPAVAAVGVAARQEWGVALAWVAAVLWLPTGCFPVAGVLLVALASARGASAER